MSLIPFGFWAASGAGGGGSAYDLLETTTLSSSASSVTFSSLNTLAAGYAHLQIRVVIRGTHSGTGTMKTNFNGDTGSNYSYHLLGYKGYMESAGYADRTSLLLGKVPGTSFATGAFGTAIIDVLDFSSTVKAKTSRALSGTVGDSDNITLTSGAWFNTDAITSISTISSSGDMAAGTRISIFGIKAA